METLQLLTQYFCMAFTIGPLIGFLTWLVYKGIQSFGGRGFSVSVSVNPTRKDKGGYHDW